MGELTTATAAKPNRPSPTRRASGWLAALPFAAAWAFAAATLGASLAPATVDEPKLEESPPPPSPPATHHDEMDFDSSELISV